MIWYAVSKEFLDLDRVLFERFYAVFEKKQVCNKMQKNIAKSQLRNLL